MDTAIDAAFRENLDKGPYQEDLTFFAWKPSRGARRLTAIVTDLFLPRTGERNLHGNVDFTANYLLRSLASLPPGHGLGLAHSHLGPGWQSMSEDDEVAERDRIAGPAFGRTTLPAVGLTRGTDGAWSGRIWARLGRNRYGRTWARTVRMVGPTVGITFHPELVPEPPPLPTQEATLSVWGAKTQAAIARASIGIVGLGSVGSILAEALARTGVQHLTLIDHDRIEVRNLDRTLGSRRADAVLGTFKVDVAARAALDASTATDLHITPIRESLLHPKGLAAALDCDILVSCVDRPWPRAVLNAIAYGHLIPVIDGGIIARVTEAGLPLHIDWRIHSVGPGHACLYCVGALLRSDVALDREGSLDDPDYIASLPESERQRYGRRNVFAFSLSVAAHQVLHLVAKLGGGPRVGGIGPQHYSAYPGVMTAERREACVPECDIAPLVRSAPNLGPLCQPM